MSKLLKTFIYEKFCNAVKNALVILVILYFFILSSNLSKSLAAFKYFLN